jgi:hypothetical protein
LLVAIVEGCLEIFGYCTADLFAWAYSRRASASVAAVCEVRRAAAQAFAEWNDHHQTGHRELASEIDRQHGEESLKQKIDVLPGMTTICAMMPAFAEEFAVHARIRASCVLVAAVEKIPAIPRRSAPPNELARKITAVCFRGKEIVGKTGVQVMRKMSSSKFVAALAFTAALGVGGASAADLGARPYFTKAPAFADALYNWGGFYVGGHVGGASTNESWTNVANTTLFISVRAKVSASGERAYLAVAR